MEDPVNLKTLAQFLLLGDPSLQPCLIETPERKSRSQGAGLFGCSQDAAGGLGGLRAKRRPIVPAFLARRLFDRQRSCTTWFARLRGKGVIVHGPDDVEVLPYCRWRGLWKRNEKAWCGAKGRCSDGAQMDLAKRRNGVTIHTYSCSACSRQPLDTRCGIRSKVRCRPRKSK